MRQRLFCCNAVAFFNNLRNLNEKQWKGWKFAKHVKNKQPNKEIEVFNIRIKMPYDWWRQTKHHDTSYKYWQNKKYFPTWVLKKLPFCLKFCQYNVTNFCGVSSFHSQICKSYHQPVMVWNADEKIFVSLLQIPTRRQEAPSNNYF